MCPIRLSSVTEARLVKHHCSDTPHQPCIICILYIIIIIDSTCARTDAAYIKRGSDPSHITSKIFFNGSSCAVYPLRFNYGREIRVTIFYSAHRVQNTSGPSAPPLSPLEQLRHDLNPPPSTWNRFKSSRGVVSSSALLGLTERISNIEQFTNLYEGMYMCIVHCMSWERKN